MKNKILLSSPHFDQFEKDVYSNMIIDKECFNKNNINNFEDRIKIYLKSNKEICCLSSGTSGIHLALVLSGVKNGDEVICQSFTFSASVNPIAYQGAKPIFIDSELDTWNMCPIALEYAIKDRICKGKKIKAIIVVHIYGMSAKIDQIVAIAKKYRINLIEDTAEALGSTYKGQKCGTFGDYGVLSFNANKIITAFGGGALVCTNESEKRKAIFLATQARDDAPHYQHSEIGFNYRISSVLAGLGRAQMEVLDKHVTLRRRNNQFYQEIFKNIDGITVFTEPNSSYFSNHWLSCILIDEKKAGFNREDIRLQLKKDTIESRPLWKPMHIQPVFKDCEFYGGTVAETLFEKGLCLPSSSNLTNNDRERVAASIQKLLLKNK